MTRQVEAVRWSADGSAVDIIDQRPLPGALVRRELRSADEVCELRAGFGSATAPPGVSVFNPAFDVTPAELVTAIGTDRDVLRPPYRFTVGGHAADGAV